MYWPRVFLWLPHFFVAKLCSPNCGKSLEKNGALSPRRVVNIDDCFCIVAWAYYCRKGCSSHFHDYSRKILDSLPPFLRLAFPETLSRKSGLSRNVLTILRVGNQDKMGPSGVHSLLSENHTLRFSILQAQYLEAAFEQELHTSGLMSLNVPSSVTTHFLGTPALVESWLSSIIAVLDADAEAHLCVSLDAEWNISRRIGVSVLQIALHSEPNAIFIVPVHKFDCLPSSLLRFLFRTKQFTQLNDQTSFNVIDLKEYSLERGVIGRKESGSLDVLAEKTLEGYLPKDNSLRKTEDWEIVPLCPDFLRYAALDVYVSRLIFERVTELALLDWVRHDSPAGSRISLLVHEGGEVAAYGKIALMQLSTLSGLRVKTQTNSRVAVDIDVVLIPTAAAILHLLSPTNGSTRRPTTKAGAYTLGQLQAASSTATFKVVTSISLLVFDRTGAGALKLKSTSPDPDDLRGPSDPQPKVSATQMGRMTRLRIYKCMKHIIKQTEHETEDKIDAAATHLVGLVYGISFDVMLARNPRYILQRTPRYIPSPDVLVPMLQHIYNVFGNALDAETQQPLFSKTAWSKANAALELTRKGYLSDLPEVPMYEKAGGDENGLQKWTSRRGTNILEGGPHGDMYRKFGALHAGPRLTLTDHRTCYNLQAFANHVFGVDWDYRHSLGLINHILFLGNYLSGTVSGAESYSEWINGDLYGRTDEKFGIAPVPTTKTCGFCLPPALLRIDPAGGSWGWGSGMRVRVPGVVVRAESKERMGMRRASAKGVRARWVDASSTGCGYIVRMLGWACKYGLRVNFDLHTIPASQNGYNHSGKLGHLNFLNGIMGVANARRAMDYIRIIVEFILQPEYADPIPIFGIVNEALVSTIGIEQITSFYLEAHDMIRSITGYGAGHGPFISIHDGFMGVATWAGFLPGSDGIVLDTQPSFAFDQQPNDAPIATSTDPASAGGTWPTQACNAARAIDGRTAFGVTTYGGDCSLWLDSSTWNATVNAGLMQYALASMDAMQDWFFWTWKIGNATDGVVSSPLYQLGLAGGWMPTGPRTSFGTCAALSLDSAPFNGTFSAWQTGGAGVGTVAPTAIASFGTSLPATI
ncbi:hypothetical protein B0H11DRAFT_2386613 [Mycena galericulata]|nr:hypothetical protein B0H11DRAFT_2386613 [Mycena galericulata]